MCVNLQITWSAHLSIFSCRIFSPFFKAFQWRPGSDSPSIDIFEAIIIPGGVLDQRQRSWDHQGREFLRKYSKVSFMQISQPRQMTFRIFRYLSSLLWQIKQDVTEKTVLQSRVRHSIQQDGELGRSFRMLGVSREPWLKPQGKHCLV